MAARRNAAGAADSVRIGRVRYSLSHWQAPSIRPWDEGVYERTSPAGPYSCWTGKRWRQDATTPAEAARQTATSEHGAVAWRGLAASSGVACLTCRGHGIVDLGNDPDSGDDLLDECPDCA